MRLQGLGMAQQLRALTAATEEPTSVARSSIREFTTAYNSRSKKPNTFFWRLWALKRITYEHTQITHENKISYKTRLGTRETAQWLIALASIPEDPRLISSTYMAFITPVPDLMLRHQASGDKTAIHTK